MPVTRLILATVLLFGWALCPTADAADSDRKAQLPVRARPLNGKPYRLFVEQGQLYVSCFHGANLTVFAAGQRRPLHQVHLDAYETPARPGPDGKPAGQPREVRLYPPGDLVAANGRLFVGQLFSDFVVVFDPATMWVVKRIPVGGEGQLAASADGKKVYFASNQKHEFHIIDTDTYEYETVPYPAGGRGIGTIAVSPDQKRLYLGIQRGGQAPDGREHGGGNSFLAVYDLEQKRYAGTLYLAQIDPFGTSDDSIPRKIVFSPDGREMFVGMFQSRAGLLVIDPEKLKVVRTAGFTANAKNGFPWVDPIGLATYRGWLLSANRNNREVMVLDRTSFRPLARLSFSEEKHAISQVVVSEDRIYLGDEEAGRVYELDGRKLAKRLKGKLPGEGKPPLELTLED
jgi:DNA-binding beta-propeller fold protein YncE